MNDRDRRTFPPQPIRISGSTTRPDGMWVHYAGRSYRYPTACLLCGHPMLPGLTVTAQPDGRLYAACEECGSSMRLLEEDPHYPPGTRVVLHVDELGADGSGQTDSTPAFEAALKACREDGPVASTYDAMGSYANDTGPVTATECREGMARLEETAAREAAPAIEAISEAILAPVMDRLQRQVDASVRSLSTDVAGSLRRLGFDIATTAPAYRPDVALVVLSGPGNAKPEVRLFGRRLRQAEADGLLLQAAMQAPKP